VQVGEEQNLDMVRGMLASFNAHFEELKAGGPPPDLERFAPDVEFRHVDRFPTPIRYVGREHYEDWFAEVFVELTGVHWSEPELVAKGDYVVALAAIAGRPEAAGPDEPELSVELAALHEIKDGLLTKLHIYLDRSAALRAAGITEE
jgi:ketosteroid isomerase-like protein